MFKKDSKEELKFDVDGIPIAQSTFIRFRLTKKSNAKSFRLERFKLKDEIATTNQYLKFLNAISKEKQQGVEERLSKL